MFIVVAILLIVLHHFFVKKIDKEDSKEYHTSSSTSTLRTSLCNRLKSYRDFKLIEDSVTSALIGNNKGEEFSIDTVSLSVSERSFKKNGTRPFGQVPRSL